MRIGIPREIKDGELRVALTPTGAGALVRAGHEVIVEPGASRGAGFADEKYIEAKAKPGKPWEAELVVKVKELQKAERAMLRRMRAGSVLVDVGVDHGGVAETSRMTSHSAPTYVEEGVVHYCVPNMPAAFPATASLALEKTLLPFVLELASQRLSETVKNGVQVKEGKVTHEPLALDTGRPLHRL